MVPYSAKVEAQELALVKVLAEQEQALLWLDLSLALKERYCFKFVEQQHLQQLLQQLQQRPWQQHQQLLLLQHQQQPSELLRLPLIVSSKLGTPQTLFPHRLEQLNRLIH